MSKEKSLAQTMMPKELFDMLSYKCPVCKKTTNDKIDKEMIEEDGMCAMCDKESTNFNIGLDFDYDDLS